MKSKLLKLRSCAEQDKKDESLLWDRKGNPTLAEDLRPDWINFSHDNGISSEFDKDRKESNDETLHECKKMIKNGKGKVIAHYVRAVILSNRAKFKEAIVDLTEAIRLDPKNPDLYVERAWAYYYEAEYLKVLEDLETLRLNKINLEKTLGKKFLWGLDNAIKTIMKADGSYIIRLDAAACRFSLKYYGPLIKKHGLENAVRKMPTP